MEKQASLYFCGHITTSMDTFNNTNYFLIFLKISNKPLTQQKCFQDQLFVNSQRNNRNKNNYSFGVSGISLSSIRRQCTIPSRFFPVVIAFTQQLCLPNEKWVSVPSSTNSPCQKSNEYVTMSVTIIYSKKKLYVAE